MSGGFSSDFNELNFLDDNELASAFRNGRDTPLGRNAVTVLISRYLNLVRKKAGLYSGSGAEFDDLAQEGFLALIGAADSFDPDRGTGFAAFAEVCVANGIKNAAKRLSRGADETLNGVSDGNGQENSPESIWFEKEEAAGMYEKISELLSKKEWDIFKLYVGGATYEEIAESLNIPKKSVDNAVFRIRKKLKALFS
ncbi:MAG: sigma-70 family RNA polymerase sigma factor [Ruminococcus sp.]|nr:sigma-70 family RNA polymerase sigma factor [Ruminococcus sp.]MCM1381814.1 sigma-70 family RNA polymerase sigma factor [Muribaculaceae bacterium]MCM1480312.1 sigma-70 family RNA polymerase sigma factor [Muribaculaceae bacterium]